MSYSSSATIARLIEEGRITTIKGTEQGVTVRGTVDDSILRRIHGSLNSEKLELPNPNGGSYAFSIGAWIYDTVSIDEGRALVMFDHYNSCHLKIGELMADKPSIKLSDEVIDAFKLWSEKYPSAPYALLKERKGIVQDKNFFRYMHAIMTAVFEEINSLNLDLLQFDEVKLKTWIESRKPVTGYAYQIDTYNMSRDTMNEVIKEIYAVHERTNTTSCMVKGSLERVGLDYYDGHLHPFHAYRAKFWSLLLVSEHAPDKVMNWSEDTTPFRLRAWGYTNVTNHYREGVIVSTEEKVTYANRYGDMTYRDVLGKVIEREGNLFSCEVRCYEDRNSGSYIAPYVDGDYQQLYLGGYTRTDEDGDEYILGEIQDEDGDCEGMYKPDHSTGLLTPVERYVTCAVSGEEILESDAIWAEQINDWVSCDFWNGIQDSLDVSAIISYFRE